MYNNDYMGFFEPKNSNKKYRANYFQVNLDVF